MENNNLEIDDDMEYFRKRLTASLKVPLELLDTNYLGEIDKELEKKFESSVKKRRNKEFAVYEKIPRHGKEENGIILAPFRSKEDAEEAMIKYGYNNDNYYIDNIK
jgi:hypothetical protein